VQRRAVELAAGLNSRRAELSRLVRRLNGEINTLVDQRMRILSYFNAQLTSAQQTNTRLRTDLARALSAERTVQAELLAEELVSGRLRDQLAALQDAGVAAVAARPNSASVAGAPPDDAGVDPATISPTSATDP
jgi:hypothetical protein